MPPTPSARWPALNGHPDDHIASPTRHLWDDTEFNRLPLHDEDVMRVLREYLEHEVLGRIAEYLGGPDATERATAAVAIIGGLIYTRYLNPLRPSARLTAADVHRILGPPLRAASCWSLVTRRDRRIFRRPRAEPVPIRV